MKYISGQHALNLPCSLETCGDWHQSALQWTKPFMRESDGSIFGDYGIEGGVEIPEHAGTFYVANHIRALLDLLELKNFPLAQGMRQDFICNDAYTPEIFEQVSKLCILPHWAEIDRFMGREYCGTWLKYKESMLR